MGRKMLWSAASVLIAFALLLASCGPRAAPTPTPVPGAATPAPVAATPTPAPVPAVEERPKYGGTFTYMEDSDLTTFDSGAVPRGSSIRNALVMDNLLFKDWSKGLAGTGEFDWGSGVEHFNGLTGEIAESWKIPNIGTGVFQIRQGVRYGLNPNNEASRLVNGRELTADDIVWNIMRYAHTPTAWFATSQPTAAKGVKAEKTGPWEVTLRFETDPFTSWFWMVFANAGFLAREVVEKYGHADTWERAVGTGPYMLTDVVPGSAATFKKNPNYWMKNPVGAGKGDQLPYVDTVKRLVVVDLSTRMAALRTAKSDIQLRVEQEDAETLMRSNPELRHKRFIYGAPIVVAMRIDKAELPFKDLRVRQALMMATDYEAIRNDFYGGNAEFAWPQPSNYKWWDVPMEQLPEKVQTLYKYNPERAKQLLADAGYPKGFKTKMLTDNRQQFLDVAAVFKAMWAKVGVDVEIQPREATVMTGIRVARSHEEMMLQGIQARYPFNYSFTNIRGRNASFIDDPPGADPTIEAAFQEVQKNVIVNWAKADEIVRKLTPYLMEQAFYIPFMQPYWYSLWQPWVKNYHGEDYWPQAWIPYLWIDQELKQKMTGRR